MIDRFYDSDGRADPVPNASGGDAASGPSGQYVGGDLPGATAKPLPRWLSVTAVWLSAPYENRGRRRRGPSIRPDPHLARLPRLGRPSPANVDYSDPADPSPVPRVES
ncbi:MAG: hypothetical protein R3F43_10965 [bacterium]